MIKYFKVISNGNFVGVATEVDFRKFYEKYHILIGCDCDNAEYIQIDEKLYHDGWMKKPKSDQYQYDNAEVSEISLEDYEAFTSAKSVEAFITPEQVEEPEEEIVDTPDIEYLRTMKIIEMSTECEIRIKNGFDIVLSDGESHHFSLTISDQLMIQSLAMKANNGVATLPWHADNEPWVFYSPEDILAINDKMEELTTYHMTYFNSLKSYIESLNTIAEIAAVEYGCEIPDEYKSEVYKKIIG